MHGARKVLPLRARRAGTLGSRPQERVGLNIIGGMATIGGAITGPPRLTRKFLLSVGGEFRFGMATGV